MSPLGFRNGMKPVGDVHFFNFPDLRKRRIKVLEKLGSRVTWQQVVMATQGGEQQLLSSCLMDGSIRATCAWQSPDTEAGW